MGMTNSTQIKKTFGVDINKSLDKTQEREVAKQMSGFTTPRRIVKGMQFFFDNVQIQRAGAKQLSNLAFNVDNVDTVLQNNGLNRLVKAIKSHMDDWKLCWFAASAIWNMARPSEARVAVGVTVPLLLRMLKIHQARDQVAHTVLGALSNLALEESNADKMIEPTTTEFWLKGIGNSNAALKLIFETLEMHKENRSVTTSALGLIANLAIRESIAADLAEYGAVSWVIKGLDVYMSEVGPENRGHPVDENRMMLIENGMAALSNLSFVDSFPRYLLIAEGLETLCRIIRSEEDIPLSEEEDGPLLRNILQSVGVTIAQAEDRDCPCYSLHQIAKMDFEQTDKLVAGMLSRPAQELLLNTRDGADMTPLHYAVFNKNKTVAELLITSGARVTEDLLKDMPDEAMKDFVVKCSQTFQSMVYTVRHSVTSSTELNEDLTGVVVGYLSMFEMRNTFCKQAGPSLSTRPGLISRRK